MLTLDIYSVANLSISAQQPGHPRNASYGPKDDRLVPNYHFETFIRYTKVFTLPFALLKEIQMMPTLFV